MHPEPTCSPSNGADLSQIPFLQAEFFVFMGGRRGREKIQQTILAIWRPLTKHELAKCFKGRYEYALQEKVERLGRFRNRWVLII
jgi:hypothetical protein